MNHIMAIGQAGKMNQIFSCAMLRACRLKPPARIITLSSRSPITTSYEIVWATARREPTRAYFELDAQPEHRVG